MNKTYRLIWSEAQQTWCVAHEAAATHGKPSSRSKKLTAALATLTLSHGALAQGPAPNTLPTGAQVVAGQAAISQSGNALTVQQGSDKAILNWTSFSIGSQASVNFQQPSSSSVALNRVVGSDPSAIYGSLTANGQVFLINPNGVLFGQGAHVDVGGLVASTLAIGNEDFLKGKHRFSRDGVTAGVTNEGELYGKYIALLAPEVISEGVIVAKKGTAALAAGEAITLSLSGDQLIDVQVDHASINTLVENKHLVQADDGTVILSAQSANGLMGQVINSGAIEAQGLTNDGGTVRLTASSTIAHSGRIQVDAGATGTGGTASLIAGLDNPDSRTTVSGSISAKGGTESGNGGFIETSASKVKIADTAQINASAAHGKAGQWLIDPTDFTIASSGGDMSGTTLSTTLGSGSSVIIDSTLGSQGTNGDVLVKDSITWNAPSSLTLKAQRNVEIDAPITVTTGSLNLQFAQSDVASNFPLGTYLVYAPVNLLSGSSFSTKYGSDGPTVNYTVIRDDAGVAAMGSNMAGAYVLGSDVALTTTPWVPLGNAGGNVSFATDFTGILDGLGHKITNLQIANTANQTGVGLFGSIGTAGLVQNLGVATGGSGIAGLGSVGILAGNSNGVINNVYTEGAVTGSDTATNVNAVGSIGGLVGHNGGLISNSYSSASVTATSGTQTLGQGADGGIGGLVGWSDSSISDSYATGAVTGAMDVGGLVGFSMGSISSSYSTGAVTGSTDGNGSGPSNVGGFVGRLNPAGFMPLLFNTYWDVTTSGQATSASDAFNSSTGLTTAQAQQQANWSGFDFTHSWVMYDGVSYPLLRSMLTPFIVTADTQTKTYDGQTLAGGGGSFTASYSMAKPGAVDDSGLSFGGTAATAVNAGSYTISPTGVVLANNAAKQDQHGYLIQFADSTLTINKATVTLSATKTYDGNTTLGTGTVTVGTGVAGETLTYSGATASDAHVATSGNYITAITLADGTGSASNYQLPTLNNANAPVTIAAKTVSLTATKTYDGTTTLGTGDVTITTGVTGEALSYSGATSNDAHVATAGKYINAITLADGTGGLASDYQLPTLNAANAPVSITAKTVGLTATKTYDGTTTLGTGDVTITTGITGEALSYTGATSNDAHVATAGKYINAITLADGTGGQASDYQLPTLNNANASVSITAKTVGLTATKTYDGTTTLGTGDVTITTGITGEALSYTGATSNDAHVATAGKYINAITLADGTGGVATDYQLPTLNNANAPVSITAKTVSLTATKTYDGTTTLGTGDVTITTGVTGEALSYTGATSNDAHVATSGKYINAITLADGTGGQASDYQLPTLNNANAPVTITPATLTYVADPKTIQAGDAIPTLTGSVTGVVPGDTLAGVTTGTATFTTTATDASPAGDYAVNGSGLTLTSSDYSLAQALGNATALHINGTTTESPTDAGQLTSHFIQDWKRIKQDETNHPWINKSGYGYMATKSEKDKTGNTVSRMIQLGYTAKDFKDNGIPLDLLRGVDGPHTVLTTVNTLSYVKNSPPNYFYPTGKVEAELTSRYSSSVRTTYACPFKESDLLSAGWTKQEIDQSGILTPTVISSPSPLFVGGGDDDDVKGAGPESAFRATYGGTRERNLD